MIELFTDGACKGNPGVGGWGVLIRIDGEEDYRYGGSRHTTNNRMELTAVIEGLKLLKPNSRVTITTDSKYVLEGASMKMATWKKNNWKRGVKSEVKNKDLWIQMDQCVAGHQITWKWVKGHSGHRENELADLLANTWIEEFRSSK